MQNLFDTDVYNQVMKRLDSLSPDSKAQWGKMDVAQMMAHCKLAFKVPLSKKKLPRIFIGRLVGWLIKAKLYNDDPWKKNLPTAPSFIIKDQRNFEVEKKQLKELVHAFYVAGPMGISTYPHPMFGKYTPQQWGMAMFKHMDHHLKQFGA